MKFTKSEALEIIKQNKGMILLYLIIFFGITAIFQAAAKKENYSSYQAESVKIALVDADGGPMAEGLKNYLEMFQMQFYWESWKNTFIFLLLQLCMCFFIPLIQALLLNELIKLQKCLTTLYILPALIPTSVNVIIWRWIWHPDYGVANQIVKFFGGEPQVWLSDPDLVKFCIIFPGVLGGGLTVLLYLSAIQGVSTDIMESAALDGCTGFKKIRHIILPNISFMIFIQLIMCVITTMQLLDAPYMYASGGPSGASTTQGIFIYNAFNDDLNYGRGSAASVVLLIVIAVLTMLQMHFEKSEKN